MASIVQFLVFLLDLYLWVILGTVIVSWLAAFEVLNTRNKWVYKFCYYLNVATNPVILRIRKVVPPLGGLDLSPIIAVFGIMLIQAILISLI